MEDWRLSSDEISAAFKKALADAPEPLVDLLILARLLDGFDESDAPRFGHEKTAGILGADDGTLLVVHGASGVTMMIPSSVPRMATSSS